MAQCVARAESYFNLLIGPAVHAQRFNLSDMCSQLPMQGGTPHAQEYTQLDRVSTSRPNLGWFCQVGIWDLLTLQLAHPVVPVSA
jgi:hypothetical protein